MKDFIPNEDDFETLLASLASHERILATEIVVADAMSRVDLDDAETFVTAFSDPHDKVKARDNTKIMAQVNAIRDKMMLLKAKLIELRNHTRSMRDRNAIDELLS